MKEDMRELFTIQRGHYKRPMKDGESDLRGYDPMSGEEWYCVRDTVVWHCSYAGGDYTKALACIRHLVEHFKTRERYLKHVCEKTSEDYYEVHYLGHTPLDVDQIVAKSEGRCPRTSPSMKELLERVYREYGDFYEDEIDEVVTEAYQSLKGKTPLAKSTKLKRKVGLPMREEQQKKMTSPLKKKVEKVKEPQSPKRSSLLSKKPKIGLGKKR